MKKFLQYFCLLLIGLTGKISPINAQAQNQLGLIAYFNQIKANSEAICSMLINVNSYSKSEQSELITSYLILQEKCNSFINQLEADQIVAHSLRPYRQLNKAIKTGKLTFKNESRQTQWTALVQIKIVYQNFLNKASSLKKGEKDRGIISDILSVYSDIAYYAVTSLSTIKGDKTSKINQLNELLDGLKLIPVNELNQKNN